MTAGLVLVTTRPGTATAALAMVEELGRQDGGQWAVAPLREGSAVVRDLTGDVRACVVPMPGAGDLPAPALVATMFRNGGSLDMKCTHAPRSGTATVQIAGS